MFFSKNIIMNQILENKKSNIFNKKLYIAQFLVLFVIISSIIISLFWKKYSKNKSKVISNATTKSYLLSFLYETDTNNTIKSEENIISIIGTIQIPKINISYPILSQCSDELLKISVCKFYGANLNESGNLCIAGHNYDNGEFFSKLFLLDKNDTIDIYDHNFHKTTYTIYNIYEISPKDMSYLSPDTNRRKRNYITYV